jgi:hypothetical protein
MTTVINHTIEVASDGQPNRTVSSVARWVAASVAILMIVVAMAASPALAMKKTYEGPYDLRSFVRPGDNPQYSCQPGSVSTDTVNVTNPSAFLKTLAVETFWIYKRNAAGLFVLTDHLSMSPHPNGILLEPGQTVAFESANVNVPPGYYLLQAEVQFYRQREGALNFLGEVNLKPNLLSDYQLWSGATSYVKTSQFTYCYVPAID